MFDSGSPRTPSTCAKSLRAGYKCLGASSNIDLPWVTIDLHTERADAHNLGMQPVLVRPKRKTRVWATTPDVVAQLGRSARQLARTSAGLLRQPSVEERLGQFIQLAALEHASKMARADLLVVLVD